MDRRIFWDNGLKTVASVANADPQELLPILMQAQPNKVKLGAKDEEKYTDKLMAKARIIADSANRIWRMQTSFQGFSATAANPSAYIQRLRCSKISTRSDF